MKQDLRLKHICLTFINLLQLAVCIDYDSWLNIKIEHAIQCSNGGEFCPRGNIALKSIRTGTAVVDQSPFNKNDILRLRELADIDGFYSVKTIVTSADNKKTEFLSSVKASAFLYSDLSDVINAWVLPNGAVIAVNFQIDNSSQPLNVDNNVHKIYSKFFLRYVDQAPVPDTASYIQKLERERDAREKGELKDNRSFLAKYWMYIVPIAVFVMISGAANPDSTAQVGR